MDNNSRKKLKGCGCIGAKEYICNENNFIVKFNFFDNIIGNCQTYSELSVLEFVTESYARSCLSLFEIASKYDCEKDITYIKNCIYRYLPTMFCFRHFVELKLKCLHLYIYKESFDNNHTIINLIENIEKKGISCPNFRIAYDYIKPYENSDPTFFRYLLSKKFKYQKQLKIDVNKFMKIKTMIQNINSEYQTILNCMN